MATSLCMVKRFPSILTWGRDKKRGSMFDCNIELLASAKFQQLAIINGHHCLKTFVLYTATTHAVHHRLAQELPRHFYLVNVDAERSRKGHVFTICTSRTKPTNTFLVMKITNCLYLRLLALSRYSWDNNSTVRGISSKQPRTLSSV